MRDRLIDEVNEAKTRHLIRDGHGPVRVHLQRLWNVKEGGGSDLAASEAVSSCWRLRNYLKGGSTRRALTFALLTHPFTEDHLKWVVEEINVRTFFSLEMCDCIKFYGLDNGHTQSPALLQNIK